MSPVDELGDQLAGHLVELDTIAGEWQAGLSFVKFCDLIVRLDADPWGKQDETERITAFCLERNPRLHQLFDALCDMQHELSEVEDTPARTQLLCVVSSAASLVQVLTETLLKWVLHFEDARIYIAGLEELEGDALAYASKIETLLSNAASTILAEHPIFLQVHKPLFARLSAGLTRLLLQLEALPPPPFDSLRKRKDTVSGDVSLLIDLLADIYSALDNPFKGVMTHELARIVRDARVKEGLSFRGVASSIANEIYSLLPPGTSPEVHVSENSFADGVRLCIAAMLHLGEAPEEGWFPPNTTLSCLRSVGNFR